MSGGGHILNGYVVVASAERVGQVHGDRPLPLRAGERVLVYRGLDREPWQGVDDARLDDELTRVRQSFAFGSAAFSPGLCPGRAQALHLLQAARELAPSAELLWIGDAPGEPAGALTSLGYDCYVDGFGSLLRVGIYTRPELFADAIGCLNAHGLFAGIAALDDYVSDYLARCVDENLEEIEPRRMSPACVVHVWSVAEES